MKWIVRIALFPAVLVAVGCGGRMPEGLGVDATPGVLLPCPDKPNCVSSFAEDAEHRIRAIRIADAPTAAWEGLISILRADTGAEVVIARDDYLYAVYTSRLMRYRDDVEFILFADDGQIGLRSASRVGHSDMGVNRDRIETIRTQLAERGLGDALGSEESVGSAQ